MYGCYLIATGKSFDVDCFLRESHIRPDDTYHRGGRLRRRAGLPDRVFPTSGFSITAGTVFGKLKPQVVAATRFLRRHRCELARLRKYPGVTDLRFVFSYCPGTKANPRECLPSELLNLLGRLGISVELSVYPETNHVGLPRRGPKMPRRASPPRAPTPA